MNKSTISTLQRALADLERERSTIDAAIVNLRGLIHNIGTTPARAARRGRPATRPATHAAAASTRRKPKWSAVARKAAALRMKKYWAGRRKAKAKSA